MKNGHAARHRILAIVGVKIYIPRWCRLRPEKLFRFHQRLPPNNMQWEIKFNMKQFYIATLKRVRACLASIRTRYQYARLMRLKRREWGFSLLEASKYLEVSPMALFAVEYLLVDNLKAHGLIRATMLYGLRMDELASTVANSNATPACAQA